ncbi:MAG: Xaa-Pro peptidase family protein [Kiritimatiellia bacterium]|nr:Xaa-Pro peptidase family protein [Kiritimatiellia bacterium]MDP6847637.1 Xaa-Pro peptidase family protein [Kiritimatiellia bacterium]
MQRLTTPILMVGSTDETPEIRYLTGFQAGDAVLLLKRRQTMWLVVRELEYGRAKLSISSGINLLTPNMLGVPRAKWGDTGALAVKLVQKWAGKRVVVDSRFPHSIARRLKRSGVGVSVARQELCPERKEKTPFEIKCIRQCQEAAVKSFRSVQDLLARSRIKANGELIFRRSLVTSELLRQHIATVLLKENCFCRDVIASSGRQTAEPHEKGHGLVLAGEPVILDIFPQHLETGYWGDFTRTVVRGRAPAELKKMYRAVKASQAAALAKIRPGVKCRTVHEAAARELEERGFETRLDGDMRVGFIHGTGHGVGLEIHEGPRLGFSEERLRKNQVVTVEPGLYYPHIGGVRIEDTVVVTARGYRYLAPCERRLEV